MPAGILAEHKGWRFEYFLRSEPREVVGQGMLRSTIVIGELPPDLQCVTVFSAAVAANATDETSARRLIEFLVSSTARSVINAKGMRAGINKE